jgi:hypothetical protein
MRRVRPAGWSTVACLLLAACTHANQATAPRSSPPPARGSAAPVTAAPSPAATTAPSPSPSPTPTPAPKVAATLQPVEQKIKVPRLRPDAAPRILDVAMSETTVSPGDKVSGSVVTTSNVASVEARIGGYAVNLVKVGVGRFALTYTVGPLPFFIHGNFNMQVVAHNTRGDVATRTVPLTVR